jgi:3'(2'),5'-bisphosphate nucleotidase
MTELLDQVVDIAIAAGNEILDVYQNSDFQVEIKGDGSPLTLADQRAHKLIESELTRLTPDIPVLSEESADVAFEARRSWSRFWLVDPLDGTKEFVMGIPEFTVSVALVDKGVPILGIIHNPANNITIHAERDQGTHLDGQPIGVSDQSTLAGSQVDASRSERKRGEFEPFEELVRLRTMGSIAFKLARVAYGAADATWSRGPKNEWDICAGDLLIREAGGQCVNLDDKPFTYNRANPKVNGIIATNGFLHQQVLSALAPYRNSARID